jgi:transglutaminase-like putative cysteine protease
MNLRRIIFHLTWVCLVLLSVGVSDVFGQKYGKVTDEEWQMQAPSGYPEANAIILFDHGRLQVSRDNVFLTYHTRIKILTEAGIEEVGERTISYWKDFDRITDFRAQTITPDGKKLEVKSNAVFEKEVGSLKQRSFVFPTLTPGCIVEYEYKLSTERWHYLPRWYFQNDLWTRESRFAVELYLGFTYTVSYQNVPIKYQQSQNSETPLSGAKVFTWTMDSLMPVSDEPYMSCEDDYRSALRFRLEKYEDAYNVVSFVKTWNELGKEFEKLIDEYADSKKEIASLAREITANAASPREKSRAIYDFVTATYKTSTDDPYGWYGHERVSEMLAEKIGSGEEKNILLAKLHQAVDIPAFPVLISTRDRGKVVGQSPDLAQFNYQVTFVQFGNEWEFLDASNRHAPYGLLPPNCLTNAGLLIDGANSEMVSITIKPASSQRTDVTRMYVPVQGAAACSTDCVFTGYYASDYGERYDNSDKPLDFIKDNFTERLGVMCSLGTYTCALDSLNQFTVRLNYTSDDLKRTLDNNIVVKPVKYALRENPFKNLKRFFPVDFTYPFVYRNVVEIHFADSATGITLPENLSFEIGGASFTRECSVNGTVAVIDSRLTISEPLYPPSKYVSVRSFFDRVARAGEDEVAATVGGAQ